MAAIRTLKVVVVGDSGVGKTCLLISFTMGEFPDGHVPTVFGNYSRPVVFENTNYDLSLFDTRGSDTAGNEEYDRLRPLGYTDADLILVCFSVISQSSFEAAINKYIPEVKHYIPYVPFIIVGLKRDIRTNTKILQTLTAQNRPIVSFETACKMAMASKASAYIECSALTQEHLQDLFREAIRAIVKPLSPKQKKSSFLFWPTYTTRFWKTLSWSSSSTSQVVETPTWENIFSSVSPAARYGHCVAIRNSTLFIVGGLCSEGAPSAPEVLRYEIASRHWMKPISFPLAKYTENSKCATEIQSVTFAAYTFSNDTLFLFGGRSNSYQNALHAFNLYTGEWRLLPLGSQFDCPLPCFGASMIYHGGCLYVFGGYSTNGMANGGIYCYDLAACSWVAVNPKGNQMPLPRWHHTAVVHGTKMVIFGGVSDNNKKLNDLWVFDLASKEWIDVQGKGVVPPPIKGHSATLVNDDMVVALCSPTTPSYMALYRCNLSTFMWNEISTVNHPPIREFHSLITSETGYLILLGGRYVNEGLPTGKMAGDAWRLQLFVNVFAMLSLDMWLAIFSYLDPKTLYSLCAVCRDFRTIASNDVLWKQFVPSLFSSSHPNMLLKDVFRVTPAHNLFGANIELSGDWIFFP